jgi:dihydroorotate dehydrogenase
MAAGAGGLSGPPLKARSLEILRQLYRQVGNRLVLVSCGGIETVDDVWERICAGATLVQIYTAFVYEGPALPGRLARGLARIVKKHGLENVQQAVGRDSTAG